MSRRLDKFMRFIRFCEDLAEMSNCKRGKVGAIIFPYSMGEVSAIGYNGPPAGIENTSCTGEKGKCGCIHAEANALIKLNSRNRDLLMYSTKFPCSHCAGLIVNSGRVRYMFYRTPYHTDMESAEQIFAASNIGLWQIQQVNAEVLDNL